MWHNLVHWRPRLQHLACCSVNAGSQARYRLIIAISAYPTCIWHPPLGRFPSEYCYAVWNGKTRMVWLPDSEKILMIYLFVLTQLTNVTDGRTDRQTPHDDIGYACVASHGKNCDFRLISHFIQNWICHCSMPRILQIFNWLICVRSFRLLELSETLQDQVLQLLPVPQCPGITFLNVCWGG